MQFIRRPLLAWVTILSILLTGTSLAATDYTIKLKTGDIQPDMKAQTPTLATDLIQQHVFIQFDNPLTDSDRERLQNNGIDLLDYVPDMTYTARVTQQPDQSIFDEYGIKWVGRIMPEHKISPYLTDVGIRDYSRRGSDLVQFIVVFHPDETPELWGQQFEFEYDAEIVGYDPLLNSVELILPEIAYHRLAEYDAVLWIEQALPEPERFNNSCRSNMSVDAVYTSPFDLTGDDVTVAEWDGGRADNAHIDLEFRVISLDASPVDYHATHVAGTIIGNGAGRTDRKYKGMAPEARLLTQEWWGGSTEMVNEYTQVINSYGAAVATNSWGYGVGDPATHAACEGMMGNYASVCTSIDNVVRGGAGGPISIVWSAGNQRGGSSKYCGSIGWTYNTITPLPTCKNVIAVGAINSNNNTMTGFSSWGPTDDGRVKPDITGPGCQSSSDYGVTSCRISSGYTSMCGTSMSAPAVAGVLVLMREQWEKTFSSETLFPSTMKGVLINSATDLGNTGPDYQYGHGNVNALKAVTKLGIGGPSWVQDSVSTDDVHLYDLTIPGGCDLLRVTLVWDDPGGIVSASQNLKNDLDLVLIDPLNNDVFPWILDPANPGATATKGVDRLNNVVTAGVESPLPGLWKARVTGYNIPYGPQKYSLVFTPDSLHTPGNMAALAAFDGGDVTADPGTTATAEFWATNAGANLDSVRVEISGISGWALTSVDTVVILNSWDSVYFPIQVDIPPTSMAADRETLTCDMTSLSDPFLTATEDVAVVAAAVHDISLEQAVGAATVNSPTLYYLQMTVNNHGNATNHVTLVPTDDESWSFSPAEKNVSVAAGSSTSVSIGVRVPAEEPHLLSNTVLVTADGDGPVQEQVTFDLQVHNPLQPPQLAVPGHESYMQDRTPEFSWIGDADSAVLYVATNHSLSANLRQYRGITGNSFAIPEGEELDDGIYYWAVKRYLAPDSSSTQLNPFVVGIDNDPPLPITPHMPRDATYHRDPAIDFLFNKVLTTAPPVIAPEYGVLQVARDEEFTLDLLTVEPVDTSLAYTSGPLAEGRWYWRVWQTDAAGNDAVIDPVRTFLIDTTEPGVPALTAPANSTPLDGDSVTWRWAVDDPSPTWEVSPEYFWIHISDKDDFSDWHTFTGYLTADSVRLGVDIFEEFQTYFWRVKANDSAGMYSDFSEVWTFTHGDGVCGDLNADGKVTLSDISRLIDHVYISKTPLDFPSLGNVNGSVDGLVTLSDITRLIDHVYISKLPLACLDM